MRVLEAQDVGAWVRTLLHPDRERPVVAVTTQPGSSSTWIDPARLDAAIGDPADVVCLETGDATWAFAAALPPRLDVYGGAVRVWWPGLHTGSDPYDHRLFFLHSPVEAEAVFDRIVAAVRSRAADRPRAEAAVVSATVHRIEGEEIWLDADGHVGVLRQADLPLADLARAVAVGLILRVQPLRCGADGTWEFSARGLLPSPWERVLAELKIGDVVLGAVQNVVDYGAFVDLLPQVAGLVHKSEIDWTFVESVGDFVQMGQLVPVKLVAFDRDGRKIELSIKRALGTDPRELPSLVPDGPPFRWPEQAAAAPARAQEFVPAQQELQPDDGMRARVRELEDELAAAAADRAQLAEQNRTLRLQAQELRRELRSAEDRHEALERRVASAADPLSSERAFLLGVRQTYARMFEEGDRLQYPLRRMRVGPEFLASLRALDGIDLDKVLEVCAQVAADKSHEIAAREVHQLRAGSRGAGTHVRADEQRPRSGTTRTTYSRPTIGSAYRSR